MVAGMRGREGGKERIGREHTYVSAYYAYAGYRGGSSLHNGSMLLVWIEGCFCLLCSSAGSNSHPRILHWETLPVVISMKPLLSLFD